VNMRDPGLLAGGVDCVVYVERVNTYAKFCHQSCGLPGQGPGVMSLTRLKDRNPAETLDRSASTAVSWCVICAFRFAAELRSHYCCHTLQHASAFDCNLLCRSTALFIHTS
jgi:hypothetical protein